MPIKPPREPRIHLKRPRVRQLRRKPIPNPRYAGYARQNPSAPRKSGNPESTPIPRPTCNQDRRRTPHRLRRPRNRRIQFRIRHTPSLPAPLDLGCHALAAAKTPRLAHTPHRRRGHASVCTLHPVGPSPRTNPLFIPILLIAIICPPPAVSRLRVFASLLSPSPPPPPTPITPPCPGRCSPSPYPSSPSSPPSTSSPTSSAASPPPATPAAGSPTSPEATSSAAANSPSSTPSAAPSLSTS